MITLWNKLIQTLISNEDVHSLRLATALLHDKLSFACWVYVEPRDEESWTRQNGLPKWKYRDGSGMFDLFSIEDVNRYYKVYEEGRALVYLKKCKQEYDQFNSLE